MLFRRHKILGLQFQEGENQLQVKTSSGTGRVTITYREGAL